MKITVLTDNNGHEELDGEWGLSFLIEYKDCKVLLDAGATDLFMKNASLLGIDLSDIDFAVLSHAHYDHGNGFVPLFEQNKQVRLFAKRLKDTNTGRVFTGHCTGEDACRILKEELGDSISQFYAGLEIVM